MSIVSLSSSSLSPPLESLPQCPSRIVFHSIHVPDLLHGKSWSSARHPANGLGCTDMVPQSQRKCRKGCFQQRKPPRLCAQANAGDDSASGSSDLEDGSTRTTVEQGKRILALQKDLLEQIAERKKLVTALKENLGTAKEQVKAFSSNDMKQADPTVLEEPPKQDITDKRRPLLVDVSPSNARGQVSQPDTSYKTVITIQESGTKPPPGVEPPNAITIRESGTKLPPRVEPPNAERLRASLDSSSITLPTRKVSTPIEEKQLLQFSQEEKEPASSVQSLDEPDVVKSSSPDNMVEAPPPLAGPNVMNVIVVAAECAPWSKTGGLGDVAGALPKALARRGHRVMVVAPRYKVYDEAWEMGVRKRYKVAGQDLEVNYFHAYIDGVDYVFADNSVFHGFANNIYGGNREDVLKRMVLLCKAAVEVPWYVPCGGVCYGDGNLVFIANDWHTALLPVYLQAYYRDNGMMEFARSILVIHNMAHQGRGPLSDFSLLDLPDHYIDKFRLYDPIGGEHMNVFMAGLLTAHRIVTVSHGYAWECQTQLGGWGLDGVMRDHNWKLRGIVNGIDEKEWSPELDAHLKGDGYSNYSLNSLNTGKAVCKAALQQELGLPVRSEVPLLGFIGRLDQQKGVDLIADAMPWMMEQDLQLVMLGTGRPDLENMLRSFEGQHRDKVRGWVGFSVKMAHRITAGCDILLMPSRFEPCGLNQLYSMRYGTIPVVHSVGGLRDTVQPFDPYSNMGTGWTFEKAEASGLIHALGNAMWTFRDFKESWRAIQIRGMSQDLSWDNAAKQYEEVMVAAKYQW